MMNNHTKGFAMASVKVAVTIDEDTLRRVDELVTQKVFPNRSRAVQAALAEKIARLERSRLARECARLEPAFEQAIADEGFGQELDHWPEY
jgi:Arc/MetJ-type ribon-helix-helix transcriptional regulator